MKSSTPVLHSPRLLDQLRECLRYRHYSLSTEKSYVYWVRFFVRWSARASGAIRLRVKDVDFDRKVIVVR